MGAGDVGVEVDHLRLDPEADLHAELANHVDERVEPRRPHVVVDVPVAETGRVVAAMPEPAVVEHEPLDADRRGRLGEAPQPLEVVVEVDRLPRVQHDRSRPAGMARAGAHVAMDARRRAVEPFVRPDEQHPRRGVPLARGEDDLAGPQQLTAAQQPGAGAGALGRALGGVALVAAPLDVHAPDLAATEAEPGGADDHEQRGVVTGAAAADLAQPRAETERAADRRPARDTSGR